MLRSTWPSLAVALTFGENEVEKMKEEVSSLPLDQQALHMLKQWVLGEKATFGELFYRLKTICLFRYGTHNDTNMESDLATSKKSSAYQAPSTELPSSLDGISEQSPSIGNTTGKPQLLCFKDTTAHPTSVDCKPSDDHTSEELSSQNYTTSTMPISASSVSLQLTSTSQLPNSSHASGKHLLQDSWERPAKMKKLAK